MSFTYLIDYSSKAYERELDNRNIFRSLDHKLHSCENQFQYLPESN